MKLLIVIVNYCTSDLTINCLEALEPQVKYIGSCRVVLVDGGSSDDSADRLAKAIADKEWSNWCDFIPLSENYGFAYGNNQAIKPYFNSSDKPEYILLLNPDTVPFPDSVSILLDYMVSHPEISIGGARTEFPDGSPQTSAFRFPTIAGEFENGIRLGIVSKMLRKSIIAPPPPKSDEDFDWVVGASMMIRHEVIDSIGLFDVNYFLYYEEVDFCFRAKKAGFRCRYIPESRIVHLIGQASGVTDHTKQNKRRPSYWFESRHRFFTKNYGRSYAFFADLAYLVGFSIWRIRRFIQNKPDPDPAHFLPDFFTYMIKGPLKHV